MKTTLEWFNELPDGYRERAIANAGDATWLADLETSVDDALFYAFIWDKPPEGCEFWWAVRSHLVNPKNPLPPLP